MEIYSFGQTLLTSILKHLKIIYTKIIVFPKLGSSTHPPFINLSLKLLK